MMERRIENLRPGLDLRPFDCGKEALNRCFQNHALPGQAANASRTYVGLEGETIIGFYALAVGHVAYDEASPRLKRGLARQPVPVMLLARLGVHKAWQGQGVGRALLRDAVLRTLQAAGIAGIRAFVTHAKDEEAKRFYEQFDFRPLGTDPLHPGALLKDLKALAGS
jgi:GNAT superfamily N-acetyltransferase